MAYIIYDPNKPGDRERAYGEWFLGFILLWGTVGSVIYYLCSIIPFIKGIWSEDVLHSVGIYALMGVIDFFILNLGNNEKMKAAGKFFTIFYGGILDVTAVIAFIISLLSLYHGEAGVLLLVISVISILFLSVIIWLLCLKFDGRKIKLFTDKATYNQVAGDVGIEQDVSNTIASLQSQQYDLVIYCHKCGKELPSDSTFCSYCGTRLK